MTPFIQNLSAFILGVATGAAGHYFGSKYTDRRRNKEDEAKEKQRFLKVKEMMPELMKRITDNLANPTNQTIREFVILPNNRVIFPVSKNTFVFYENEYQNIREKIDILNNYGYIIEIKTGNTPIYQFKEYFVELVLHQKENRDGGN